MSVADFLLMAVSNLTRSRLRTGLTAAGVIIGVGALVSMLSFGSGMQRNVRQTFDSLDAFTLLTVSLPEQEGGAGAELDEAALARLRAIPGVALAYRDAGVPARLSGPDGSETALLQAVPLEAGRYAPFTALQVGRFFSDPQAREIILSESMAVRLGLSPTQEALNTQVNVETASLDPRALIDLLRDGREGGGSGLEGDLFSRQTTVFRVVALWGGGGFAQGRSASAFIPLGAAEGLRSLGFSSVFELLRGPGGRGGPGSVLVRVERPEVVEPVARAIRSEGYEVFSFLEEFDEVRRALLAMNGILGAVGVIALIVAALGIVNTMVTAVMERTREIGIMMAIGASRIDIRRLFLVEAAAVGLFGGALGILLGWGVSRLANRVGNLVIRESGVPPVEFFYLPGWLVLGALLFSLLLSLAAALYPAGRAARLDPVSSLRRE